MKLWQSLCRLFVVSCDVAYNPTFGNWQGYNNRSIGFKVWNEAMTMTDDVLHKVISCSLVKDYILTVVFEDGVERTIDLEPILAGPIFGALRDRSLFNQVRLDRDFGALEWPNGADIDPAVLYDWPHHVEAIVEQRQRLFAVPA